jgi:hypothetical protein
MVEETVGEFRRGNTIRSLPADGMLFVRLALFLN